MWEKKAWAIDSANTILEQLSKHLKNSVSVPNALKEIINMYKLGKKHTKIQYGWIFNAVILDSSWAKTDRVSNISWFLKGRIN